jgi:YbbR domain-containing protein
VVSRSPASIEVTLERRGRKAVVVRPDLEGAPPPDTRSREVEVDPPRVWLTGARGDVLRLAEVMTETIDVTGATQSFEREARLSLGANHVWRETEGPVKVRILVEPVAPAETSEEQVGRAGAPGTEGA